MYKFLLFFIIPFLSFSQMREKPLLFSHKGEYIHTFSKFAFPDYWQGFNREELVSYDQKNYNIGSTYLLKDGKKLVAKINIYIYPSEATNENLREQFNAFKIAVNRNATNAPNLIPEFLKLENEKVAVSGIRSVFDYNLMIPDFFKGQKEQKNTSLFSLYDCGVWNIKFRMTSEKLDASKLKDFEQSFVNSFKLLEVAKNNAFDDKTKVNIVISKTAQRDSLMLKSIITEAEAKKEWLSKNKSINELSSGINDFNIEASIYALDELVKFYEANKNKWTATDETKQYLEEISRIVKANKTKDFIYDRTEGVVIYDEGEKNKSDYFDFKLKNNINEALKELMYKIYYE